MADLFWGLAVATLKGFSFLYDAITYIPYALLGNADKNLAQSNRVKARSIDGNPSSAYRTVDHFDSLSTELFPGCNTMAELFAHSVQQNEKRPCLGTRVLVREEDEMQPNGRVFKKLILGKYEFETFGEVYTRISHFGSGLLALGQQPGKNICVFAETRAEWMIAAQACFMHNFPLVTLYSTLGEEAIAHGINESEVAFVITSNELIQKFKKILSKMPSVTHLIYMDNGKKPDLEGFPSNVHIRAMKSVEELGSRPENMKSPITKPTREDLAVIMYTSGSTGVPKGVMISHGNLVCGMSGQCSRVPGLGPKDRYIGYLPLAHVLELTAEMSCLAHGASIGYSSPLTLSDQSNKIKRGSKGDASQLKPTLMAAVPVIMDRLYKAVWEKVNEGGKLTKSLFTFAYDYKRKNLERGHGTPLIDKFIFKKIRKLLGGHVRMMLSGGAPLSEETQRFMNVCMCCPVLQGYGLTETCGAGTIQAADDLSTGRVGAPLCCNEIKLVDWEEGGYRTSDTPCPRGEIVLGGGNITNGYYKNPEKTAEDFRNEDGVRWFYTGDIGEFQHDGSLKIIDRKKDLVKLQAGEYVSLAKVETVLKMSSLIDNCCVYADSSSMYTICLVVPNPKQVKILGENLELDISDWNKLCDEPALVKEMLKLLQEQGVKGKLERFEIPQKIKICSESWTPDSGLVTDAFKLKRKVIQNKYQEDITKMYT